MQQSIQSFINIAGEWLTGSLFMILLLGTGAFFTYYLRFPQVRLLGRATRLLLGIEKSSGGVGDTSLFQAVATSLAGSIGAGSIVGVCIAIHIGGPGALFWMWITALLGMSTRMAEAVASHLYREKSAKGTMVGGPMYSMQKRLNMRWLGILFASCTLFSVFLAGCMPQVNAMTGILFFQWGLSRTITGVVIALLVSIVIIGGAKRIGQVTAFLVPAMTFTYLSLVGYVMIYNYDQIIPSFLTIFQCAFAPAPVVGGFIGASTALARSQGLRVGFFTNEAGIGSSAIAHSASQEEVSGKVGIMSMLEPFISTIFMCTLTAMAVLVSGSYTQKVTHTFDKKMILVVAGHLQAQDNNVKNPLYGHIHGEEKLPLWTGQLQVKEGVVSNDVTFLHADSIAENVVIKQGDGEGKILFNGVFQVENGRIISPDKLIEVQGHSLTTAHDLALHTFSSNPLGFFISLLMILCLLLFSFSTLVSFSYFGDRALTFLGGERYIIFYKFLYIASILFASSFPSEVVWKYAVVSCAMMAIPNLIGLLLMRKEIREAIEKA